MLLRHSVTCAAVFLQRFTMSLGLKEKGLDEFIIKQLFQSENRLGNKTDDHQ